MSILLVTPCTQRKPGAARHPVLRASDLPCGTQSSVAEAWVARVQLAGTCAPASALYGGRGFNEALATVAPDSGALWIVSAGLGLLDARTQVPAYDLTVTPGGTHSVQAHISDGRFCARQWWAMLNACLRKGWNLAALVQEHAQATVVVTLSAAYAALVADDLAALPGSVLARVRIVGPASDSVLPPPLRPCWMPYDVRFDGPDGPLPGTRADFAQRAARHFVGMIGRGGSTASAAEHQVAVLDMLRDWRHARVPDRRRLDDAGIRAFILRRWEAAGGSSSRMLRLLRDEERICCEQGRFAALFRTIKQKLDR